MDTPKAEPWGAKRVLSCTSGQLLLLLCAGVRPLKLLSLALLPGVTSTLLLCGTWDSSFTSAEKPHDLSFLSSHKSPAMHVAGSVGSPGLGEGLWPTLGERPPKAA